MSIPQNGQRRGPVIGIPSGETVASFDDYAGAQAAVDKLAAADFPVRRASIVGSDLKSVERITGRMSYGRAAAAGALSGAWLGLFFGLLLVIVSPESGFVFVGAAALIGAAFGMLFNVVTYTARRRRRDFSSIAQIVASSYSVIVEVELANKARNILGVSATSSGEQGPSMYL
ncbi:hypothetical protein CLV49_3560 [Labedella gwakjiensis]|uniref:General stress protein 17M-like domain-containing protein n=1 Tax=Labedella gwakjiensis TaxID=390269 RepID=A0A2P8H114_9MICO|nr:general stress protein [Labedella gwakjiensis]PSL39905.1 hypothetical protein CLV49_3560 [Labedella gwakjiensis]